MSIIRHKNWLFSVLLLPVWLLSHSVSVYATDNIVNINNVSGVNLIKFQYTIDDYSVTDDAQKFSSGTQLVFGGNSGSINFPTSKRKGSSGVANWFNKLIPASENTFGHTSGELNLATIGTLVLDIQANTVSSPDTLLTLYGIAFAQGHSGASNNWWFGGKNCYIVKAPPYTVSCPATDSSGAAWSVSFQRGTGSSPDEVKITAIPSVQP